MTYWRVLPSRISKLTSRMRPRLLCNIQGFRAPFATRCQSASGREKDLSLFFFFPMDGFTLGIPSIFKIRISTLTLLTSLSVRSRRIVSLIDNSLHCLLFLLSALSSLSLFRFLTLSRLFPTTPTRFPLGSGGHDFAIAPSIEPFTR